MSIWQKLRNHPDSPIKQFNDDKLKWHSKMNRYRGLLMILNQDDTRNELIQYIKMREKNKSLISTKKQNEIIEDISKNEIQQLPNYDDLQILKVDHNTLYYWLVKFKDWRVAQVCNEKPVKHHYVDRKKYKFLEIYKDELLINQLPLLRCRFLKNNPTLKYYTITIDIKGESFNDDVYFRKSKKDLWDIRRRTIDSSGPGCSIH